MSTSDSPRRGFFVRKILYWTVLLIPLVALPTVTISSYGLIFHVSYADSTTLPLIVISAPKKPLNPTGSFLTWITAYASVPELTSDHPFITASGVWVHDGTIAANFLPFGTQIEIPELFGDKIFTVEDRMNERFNERMDIWMSSVDEALIFGIHNAKVIILKPELAIK